MKRFLSVLLTLALLMSMVSISAMAEGGEPITITVYDAAANYHGEQKGWFATSYWTSLLRRSPARRFMPPALKKAIWVISWSLTRVHSRTW